MVHPSDLFFLQLMVAPTATVSDIQRVASDAFRRPGAPLEGTVHDTLLGQPLDADGPFPTVAVLSSENESILAYLKSALCTQSLFGFRLNPTVVSAAHLQSLTWISTSSPAWRRAEAMAADSLVLWAKNDCSAHLQLALAKIIFNPSSHDAPSGEVMDRYLAIKSSGQQKRSF